MQPSSQDQGDADLYLLGAGVSFPEQLTLQAIAILTACKRICSNLPENVLALLPEDLRANCVSLWPLYQDNRHRDENYRVVAEAVIDSAAEHRPVAWMTPGHPLVFDSVSRTLLQAARARGWKVSVIPGISCIDTICAEIGYDPAGGLVIHDATSLAMGNIPLLPSLAALLLQPSAFGSALAHYSSEWTPNLSRLSDHLLQFYSPAHRCAFVRSASHKGGLSQVRWYELSQLNAAPFDVVVNSTLFLPPLGQQHHG